MVQINIGNICYFSELPQFACLCVHNVHHYKKQDYQYGHVSVMLMYSEMFSYYLLMYLKEDK